MRKFHSRIAMIYQKQVIQIDFIQRSRSDQNAGWDLPSKDVQNKPEFYSAENPSAYYVLNFLCSSISKIIVCINSVQQYLKETIIIIVCLVLLKKSEIPTIIQDCRPFVHNLEHKSSFEHHYTLLTCLMIEFLCWTAWLQNFNRTAA